MEWIGIIASVASIIAAIAAVATLRYTRGNIRRRIAAKEREISMIDIQLVNIFGLNDNGTGRAMTSLDYKKEKLQREIEDLRLEL